MSRLYMMVTITDRNHAKKFTSFYAESGLDVSLGTLGHGTAASEILDYFGLENNEKAVLFHIVTDETWASLKKALRTQMKIEIPGTGIAFTIPLSSIGGKKALNYLTANQTYVKEEETSLTDTKYELLVVISNQGYTEQVMDAARKAKASGGTVIHAKGTGTRSAEKFLGVTLVPEREMVFIVVRSDRKNDIMRSIMDEAGIDSKAGSIVFSLPVTDTAGMRLMEVSESEE
ncbi:MAG: P-II family nitrogen regulator [Ruminococcaceae bacterium]|nr:P-II family nitrogen regulator [Oscillospiraceae bacterium]